jgi:murein DD-endopeptidase MepM/ murein hydrolase activator NlpD
MKKRNLIILITVLFMAMAVYVGRIIYQHGEDSSILFQAEVDTTLVPNVEEPILKYGLPIDSFDVESGSIRRNQNLSQVLAKYGVSALQVDRIVRKAENVFDLRKIRYNNAYSAFLSKDSLKKIHYFVYEHTPVEYMAISFNDSIEVWTGEREIVTRKMQKKGVIETSLWNTMNDIDAHPLLANELSDIYAWVIDFFALQPGDSFKVIYTENYVDSTWVGINKIETAIFHHSGRPFYAFSFLQDSIESYYDEEGNSLRKAFLKAPLKFSRISSRFSLSRMHPVLRIRRPHRGVDYAAPTNTPVYAIGDGKVIAKAWDRRGGGNYLKIKHNGIYTTAYLHLNGFAKGLNKGDYVKQGQLIGYVGRTGLATGPHLDFRFYKNGKAVDPLKIEAPPVEPVKAELRDEYQKVKQIYMMQLSQL